MEHIFFKQQKELDEFKKKIGNYVNPKMNYTGNLSKNNQRWTKTYRLEGC
jgi:hypothetical protein